MVTASSSSAVYVCTFLPEHTASLSSDNHHDDNFPSVVMWLYIMYGIRSVVCVMS
jgi:hypothetical protein